MHLKSHPHEIAFRAFKKRNATTRVIELATTEFNARKQIPRQVNTTGFPEDFSLLYKEFRT